MTYKFYFITLFAVALGLLLLRPADADDTIETAEKWYRDSYAPLWVSATPEHLDEAAGHYADHISFHPMEGEPVQVDTREWFAAAVEEWIGDGWVGSDLAELEVRKAGPSRVTFRARWHDRYAAKASEDSCGWYTAEIIEGNWQFQAYGDSKCPTGQ